MPTGSLAIGPWWRLSTVQTVFLPIHDIPAPHFASLILLFFLSLGFILSSSIPIIAVSSALHLEKYQSSLGGSAIGGYIQ